MSVKESYLIKYISYIRHNILLTNFHTLYFVIIVRINYSNTAVIIEYYCTVLRKNYSSFPCTGTFLIKTEPEK